MVLTGENNKQVPNNFSPTMAIHIPLTSVHYIYIITLC